ncbi:hypothetical protein GQ55_3G479800 [Panicum hallii var. hallii]|uniref:Thaumatin-like protein n=1 Tax=Panicum hallii var. hallii TaxID=1504633 RepID=A0A2T7EJL6_9POAL|nr:hypothetical protein GQ55_3G479800 [Panicum hallii var. hallii]
MASPAAASSVLLLLLAAFTAGAGAATFTIKNNCGYTVWPAATPVGGGRQLNPGQTWTLQVPAGTQSGRIWGRTGCSFNGAGRGRCATGDCAGALSCTLSGQPPLTLAEFTIGGGGANDYYDISVIDGYNLPMDFSCSNGKNLHCGTPRCPDAYLYPSDNSKNHGCRGNSNYKVTFCP